MYIRLKRISKYIACIWLFSPPQSVSSWSRLSYEEIHLFIGPRRLKVEYQQSREFGSNLELLFKQFIHKMVHSRTPRLRSPHSTPLRPITCWSNTLSIHVDKLNKGRLDTYMGKHKWINQTSPRLRHRRHQPDIVLLLRKFDTLDHLKAYAKYRQPIVIYKVIN